MQPQSHRSRPSSARIGAALLAAAVTTIAADRPAAGAMQESAVGVIEGTVEVRRAPPRRRADRYASGRVRAPKPVQQLPAVVYLRGRITGDGPLPPPPTVAQRDTAFAPAVLAIEVGVTVQFPNDDPFFHNVFSYSRVQRFDLGRYPMGQSKSVTFQNPGVVKVYCEVHDFMRAVILVLENPFHAIVAEDGTFTISNVPAGTYELVAWHADLGEQAVSVTVTNGGAARVGVTLR